MDRPLVSDEVESNDWARNCDVEGACYQNEGSLCLSRPVGLVHEQRLPSESPHLVQGSFKKKKLYIHFICILLVEKADLVFF